MSDTYSEYIEGFSIEIADFNPIGPTIYIPLSETLPKCNNGIINIQNNNNCSFNYEIINYDLYREPNALEKFVIKIEKELQAIQEDLSALAK
ncbi:19167_t:CDS:2 [Gigaspora margarita]|uniref:19167_t:CDS:1 n=1 Tax=Gigaspora margarita TaxID=4874 RepID=A0ABN7WMV5_GIGMA|nr:19167_t:CDS:2 [Gigaspora margarita]